MEKKHYRNIYKKIRQDISIQDRTRYSQKTLDHIRNSNIYQGAQSLFVFLSMGDEIQTIDWIETFFQDEKDVYIPFTQKGDKNMYMTQIHSLKETQPNPMGILQVPQTLLKERSRDKVDLVLVPGLAFDDRGFRMGYGGGFYDRFLGEKRHKKAYGVGFKEQRVSSVVTTETDLAVEGYFSQEGLEEF